MSKPTYELTLHKTYFDTGFFNLGVSIERFIRKDGGPIKLRLGSSRRELDARVDRTCNKNGTPRVLGGPELRNWFQANFGLKDVVIVEVVNPTDLWLRSP